jgi:hypothetical protein
MPVNFDKIVNKTTTQRSARANALLRSRFGRGKNVGEKIAADIWGEAI